MPSRSSSSSAAASTLPIPAATSPSPAPLSSDPFGLNPAYAPPLPIASHRSRWRKSAPVGTVEATALHGYLCFSYVPSPATILTGHVRLDAPPRWRPPAAPVTIESVGALLRASVWRHLPPDSTPVGVYLSGGLDSALVAALLVEAGARVIAYTLDLADDDSERPVAEHVAAHLGIPLRVVPAGPTDIARALDTTVAALPQPYGDAVTVPLWLLGAAACQEVSVVFNGEGGDQLFGGWANKPMVAAGVYGADDEVEEYLQTFHRFLGLTDRLYTPEQRRRVGEIDPRTWVAPHLDPVAYPALLHRLRAANVALKGAQNIAPRCAALAACHGLTVAAPFFDEALCRATFGLPEDAFLNASVEKFALKKLAMALLPPQVVWREKRGMGAPSATWCLDPNPVRKRVRSLLAPRRLKAEGRFDPRFVGELLAGVDPSPSAYRRRRVAEKLWCLAVWEAWRDSRGLA